MSTVKDVTAAPVGPPIREYPRIAEGAQLHTQKVEAARVAAVAKQLLLVSISDY